MRYKTFLALLLSVVVLQGCSFVDGGNSYRTNPTVGQELIDLDRALDSGAIDASEYNGLKDKILRR